MNIIVLNGSPKGATSVTMQYVQYVQKLFPQHELPIVDIALRLKKIEGDESAFREIVEEVRAADGVLWAFPLYILAVHGNYKRFIEMIWERGAERGFEGKYAASLSTSIHYFDHTAHIYVQAICDDLGMKYVGAFSPEMRDLLKESGQVQTQQFAQRFFNAIERQAPTSRRYPPVVARAWDYAPGPGTHTVEAKGKRVVIVTDAESQQANLLHMIGKFRDAFAGEVDTINLHDLDIKGGCLGCLRCGYDNECAYTGKDEFIEFYNTRLKTADIVVFAGAIRDRYLSATWKTFFDRSFFNTHTPSLVGKQLAFLISGPLGQNENLREILQAWTELQRANLAGIVTDEPGDSAQVDGLLQDLAENLAWCAEAGYVRPPTFLGVGGMRIFRDDVWGHLRTVFQADHRAYRRMGIYDFPQRDWRGRALNAVTGVLFQNPAGAGRVRAAAQAADGAAIPEDRAALAICGPPTLGAAQNASPRRRQERDDLFLSREMNRLHAFCAALHTACSACGTAPSQAAPQASLRRRRERQGGTGRQFTGKRRGLPRAVPLDGQRLAAHLVRGLEETG